MKGRRRARRTALQALYELDLSEHGVDGVLTQRLRDLHMSAASGSLDSGGRRVLERVLADHPGDALPSLTPDAISARYEVDEDAASGVVDLIEGLRPHAAYSVAIVRGVHQDLEPIDVVIARIAPEWPVPQMAPVDRNVLRIALWEIGSGGSPVRVAINEAVELARAFSGEGARRMVNGALGAYTSGDQRLTLAPFIDE